MAPVLAGHLRVGWPGVVDFGVNIFVQRIRISRSDEISVLPIRSIEILRLRQKSRGLGLHSMRGVPICLFVNF